MDNYDMVGLEGLGEFTGEDAKRLLMIGVVGGATLVVGASIAPKVLEYLPEAWEQTTKERVRDGLFLAAGALGGYMLYTRGYADQGVAVAAALGGAGIAGLAKSFLPPSETVRYPTLAGGLSGSDLSALHAAVVTPGAAFRPTLSGTVVQGSQLSAPVVTGETLGAYAPWLA